MIIEVNQPDQYSMARGESKDKSVSGDMRLGSEKNKSERKDARTQFKTEKEVLKAKRESGELSRKEYRQSLRTSRKAKLNATKLQLLKRFSKDGKPLFIYRLKKVFKEGGKHKKKMPDGTIVDVAPQNVIETPQGTYDASEIAKVMGSSVAQVQANPQSIAQQLVPVETSTKTADEVVPQPQPTPTTEPAIVVPASNITQTPEGYYATPETQTPDEAPIDVKEDEGKAQGKKPLSKTEKILLWGGIGLVVAIIGFVVVRKVMSRGKTA